MIKIVITLSILFSSSLFAQKTYWRYEKTTPILTTAIDIELIVSEIKKGGYALLDLSTNNILLYLNTELLERPFKFDKRELKIEIVEDKLKVLYRPGVEDIYMMTFLKTNENDFIKNVQKE